jgi:hypothetical protein
VGRRGTSHINGSGGSGGRGDGSGCGHDGGGVCGGGEVGGGHEVEGLEEEEEKECVAIAGPHGDSVVAGRDKGEKLKVKVKIRVKAMASDEPGQRAPAGISILALTWQCILTFPFLLLLLRQS